MKIEQLIELTENRLRHYHNMVKLYTEQGDVENVIKYQTMIDETVITLDKLKTLL